MTASKIITIKDNALFLFVFCVFLIGNHTGSLVLSGAAALAGLVGILGHKLPEMKTWPLATWAFLAFVVWVYASYIWSSYDTGSYWNNAVRFLLGVPLYMMMILAVSAHNEQQKNIWRWLLIGGLILSASVFIIDFLTDYSIYRLGDSDAQRGYIEKNLGHGICVLAISTPGIAAIALRSSARGKQLAITAVILVGIATYLSGNAASLMAFIAMCIMTPLAIYRPRIAIALAFTLAALVILFAPFIAIIASDLSAQTRAAIPASWDWRVETWGYTYNKILQSPITGNGFDALRTYDDKMDLRTFKDISIIPMHAHNAGLHIWVETGLIGAVLAASSLALAAHKILNSAWATPLRQAAIALTVVAVTLIANLSYSAWQDWWLAGIAFSICFITLIPQNNLHMAAPATPANDWKN